ncbi:molybdopterin converting factor [Novosphingobium fuchskuhlense]|jgi:molybdopterin synthase catalytic subunit|uniref:Molybdopterin synthase catalytic subunit n=1 Tax=Novosphingobium fuchskuhlense TaxID=1117702 RepID=A0A117UY06_9SPHN|nr:molybdenum cofactor biosynthesis protein MoaE [Novosphingobium fuchskuhlense]KUR72915.1 molybdopterin converting factor [Novosphingobium fuchskuhlense]
MAPITSDVRLLGEGFSPTDQLATFNAAHPEAGGIVSFLGQVRSEGGAQAVEALELRHYAAMTLPGMEALAAATKARWVLDGLLIIHRYGVMHPGDPIVLVAAAARHRRDAFAAADFAMDHLKSQSWFWKREKTAAGWRWIEPRADDHRDLARW